MLVKHVLHIPMINVLSFNACMKTIADIRRNNLELLRMETVSKTLRELADNTDTQPAHLSQIRNRLPDSRTGKPKEMGDVIARRLETGMGKPRGWMDQTHEPKPPGAEPEPPTGIIAKLIDALAPLAEQSEKTDRLLAENRELAAQVRSLEESVTLLTEEHRALKAKKEPQKAGK
jgi:hypothetical protein